MDRKLRDTIRERALYRCEYCQLPEKFDRLPFQADHIIAEKHGGRTVLDNLAFSCYDCNMFKGPNIAGVDSESGDVVQLFHPRRDPWQEHFRWQGAVIVGVTPVGRATMAVLRVNREDRVPKPTLPSFCESGALSMLSNLPKRRQRSFLRGLEPRRNEILVYRILTIPKPTLPSFCESGALSMLSNLPKRRQRSFLRGLSRAEMKF